MTLREFTLEATRRYLQSVVFVDDKIFEKPTGMAVAVVDDLPTERKRIYQPEEAAIEREGAVADLKGEEQEEKVSYSPKDLVSSFAKERIICALYEPPEEFDVDPESEIFKLCERPDIIILDWDLSGDQGQKTLNLIAALVKQSEQEFPHHTRLLSIYTIDRSLEGVANQISDKLSQEGLPAEPDRSSFRIQSGATRILVFGKDFKRIGEEQNFTVKEEELASRLIMEFAQMNSGILPAYALHGMAALRRNAKRILDRFHGDLNGAFLLHRALSKGSEEAFDQLPELLADELESILSDQRLPQATISDITTDAVLNLKIGETTHNWTNFRGKAINSTGYEAVIKELLLNGRISRDNYKEISPIFEMPDIGFSRIDPNLMQDFLNLVDADKAHANERLATLFDTRTQYDEEARVLFYGTIIRRRQLMPADSPWVYSFCLMPVCDCIRLDQTKQCQAGEAVEFPFWQMREDVFQASEATRRGVAIRLPDNSYKLLTAGGKSRDRLWVQGFPADPASGTVRATKDANQSFILLSNEQLEIEWIAQLKPMHAQRIAHDVGQSLSRVGLIEAEWLRLLCDR
jgi:hypothetical protein